MMPRSAGREKRGEWRGNKNVYKGNHCKKKKKTQQIAAAADADTKFRIQDSEFLTHWAENE